MAFNLQIITPEEKVFDSECYQANLPGSEGTFGVLAGHMNLVAFLEPGIVEIYKDATSAPEKIAILDGFADVSSEHCVLLVEKSLTKNAVDILKLNEKIESLKYEITKADSKVVQDSIEKEIKFLEAAIKIAG